MRPPTPGLCLEVAYMRLQKPGLVAASLNCRYSSSSTPAGRAARQLTSAGFSLVRSLGEES